MSNNEIDIHMSNNDSIDEETKRLLAEVDADAQSSTNDSKESKPKKEYKNDDFNEYDVSYDIEADDKEW